MKRAREPKPIAPEALYGTRQQVALLYGCDVQLVDEWTRDNPAIKRLRVPGRGRKRPGFRILINLAELQKYLDKFAVAQL